MKQLSSLTPTQLAEEALLAILRKDVQTIVAIDVELRMRAAKQKVAADEDEFFTMESKRETMKVLQRVMS